MSVYVCDVCKWEYDEAKGLPEAGIAPGTKWEDLPEGFTCPRCRKGKDHFHQKERPPEAEAPAFDRKITRQFSYGLFVLTAREGGKDNGCIINTAIQAASEPLRISIAVNKANYTHDMVARTGAFGISFLSEEATFETFQRFGFQSGRDVEKLEGVPFARSKEGIPYLTEGVNGFLTAKVVQSIDLGSHTMFIAEITDAKVLSKAPSLTYAYYFAHIKPKPEAKVEKKTGWVCTICGYIYEGEELPPDFICPLCKHPASDFKKL